MKKKSAKIFDKIDELGLVMFGESDSQSLQMNGPIYQKQVILSYESNEPLIGPKYALLKVTNRCNSGCFYCNHSIYSTTRLSQNDPTTDQIKKVVDEVASIGAVSINLTGGEPLLRRDLPEIVRYVYTKKLVSVLLTNGLILADRWRQLAESRLSCLLLTLDSLDPTLYQQQRGADFSKAWAGFESSLRLRDSSPTTTVLITVTVTQSNLLELPKIVEKLASYGVAVWFSPYHQYNPSEEDASTPKDSTQIQAVVKELISLQKNGYPIANSRTYLEHFSKFFVQHGNLPDWYRCYAGYTGVYVDAGLNVRPCWSWSLPSVGNLLGQDLKTIWTSDIFRQQRERIKRLDCSRCWLLCTAEPSIRFSEWRKENL